MRLFPTYKKSYKILQQKEMFQIFLTLTVTQMKMSTAYFQHLVKNLKTVLASN